MSKLSMAARATLAAWPGVRTLLIHCEPHWLQPDGQDDAFEDLRKKELFYKNGISWVEEASQDGFYRVRSPIRDDTVPGGRLWLLHLGDELAEPLLQGLELAEGVLLEARDGGRVLDGGCEGAGRRCGVLEGQLHGSYWEDIGGRYATVHTDESLLPCKYVQSWGRVVCQWRG